MSKIEVSLLGIGAVKLRGERTTLYVDAFSEIVRPQVEKADLILVTHGDWDHFEPQETARAALETGAVVVGPPGIAYPLLSATTLPAERLRILYPPHFKKPLQEEIRGVRLKVYQTKHFNNWEPDHISYLIELEGQKFYITGDSAMLDEDDPDLQHLDGLIYSMVMDASTPEAIDAHVALLEDVQRRFAPRCLLPNHLLHCNWAIAPAVLREAISQKGFTGIVVLEATEQTFESIKSV